MSNQNLDLPKAIIKGDVVWVPYRKGPMWPALVQNVYRQKISYIFFPLRPGDLTLRKSNFSCASKLVYAFVPSEPLSEDADDELQKAFAAACEYCSTEGLTRGSLIPSYGEAGVEEIRKNRLIKSKDARKAKAEKRNRDKVKTRSDDEEEFEPLKKAVSSSLVHASPSGSQMNFRSAEAQSAEMMKVIDEHLESMINDVWKTREVVECQKNSMKGKMTIKLKNNAFLEESDYSALFERIVNLVRTRNASLTLITAFNLTASHIIPHVLINCYAICKNVGHQVAKDVYHNQNTRVLGLDPSMRIPVTDHLEELCRLACDESDAIQR